MRVRILALCVVLSSLAFGCASRSRAAQAGAVNTPRCVHASVKKCTGGRDDGPPYYVTWAEYYNGVMDDAYRRNSSVIWVNPPSPVRKMISQPQLRSGSAPASGVAP
jgi:hypothetical protein